MTDYGAGQTAAQGIPDGHPLWGILTLKATSAGSHRDSRTSVRAMVTSRSWGGHTGAELGPKQHHQAEKHTAGESPEATAEPEPPPQAIRDPRPVEPAPSSEVSTECSPLSRAVLAWSLPPCPIGQPINPAPWLWPRAVGSGVPVPRTLLPACLNPSVCLFCLSPPTVCQALGKQAEIPSLRELTFWSERMRNFRTARQIWLQALPLCTPCWEVLLWQPPQGQGDGARWD